MELTTLLLVWTVGLALGAALGLYGGVTWARSRQAHLQAVGQGMVESAEVLQGLDRLSDQMQHLDAERQRWQGHLEQHVADMRSSTETLRRETATLSTALRRPQVRGRWGELHLRRAVELAGLVERCDFDEQVRLEDGAQRPDLVVHLAGGRDVVVDAKVPLDAFLDATAAEQSDDPAISGLRASHLARHARQVRTHVDALAGKRYWRSLPDSPELVVLFVPGESFLSAALEAEPTLIEYAASRHVVLATPTTLIALLRTVAHGWQQERLAEEARTVHRLGRELHDRLATMTGHLDGVGRALDSAVVRYNATVGSFEGRVLVSARRFTDLGVSGEDLPTPRRVDGAARRTTDPDGGDEPDTSTTPEPVPLDAARRAHRA